MYFAFVVESFTIRSLLLIAKTFLKKKNLFVGMPFSMSPLQSMSKDSKIITLNYNPSRSKLEY